MVKDSSLVVSSHTSKDEASFNVFISSIGVWFKIFNHKSSIKSAHIKLLKCLIRCTFNRGVVLNKKKFKGIGVIDVHNETLAMNNDTTV